jgi:hypothetical protein
MDIAHKSCDVEKLQRLKDMTYQQQNFTTKMASYG